MRSFVTGYADKAVLENIGEEVSSRSRSSAMNAQKRSTLRWPKSRDPAVRWSCRCDD